MTYKYKSNIKSKTNSKTNNKTKSRKSRKYGKSIKYGKSRKIRKMKGGFSVFSVWDTMTYNLSNALSTFTISPPTAIGNVSEPVNPSVSKQFLQE